MLRGVRRTFKVLEVLSSAPEGRRLHEMGRTLGLSDPTLLRFLESLQELGVVRQREDGRWLLTQGMRRFCPGGEEDLRSVALPVMRRLGERLGEDIHLSTLDADSVICIEALKSSHLLQVAFETGFRAPVHASAAGKAILAHLDPAERDRVIARIHLAPCTPRTITDARKLCSELDLCQRRGFALDDEELENGISCLAAPVFDGLHVVAGLSVTVPTQRKRIQDLVALSSEVIGAAAEISGLLGTRQGDGLAAREGGR